MISGPLREGNLDNDDSVPNQVPGMIRGWIVLWLTTMTPSPGCGRTSTTTAAHHDDGGSSDAAGLVLPALSFGVTEVATFAYRERGGQVGFSRAREGEAKGDWPAVAAACREALVADPDHLDAAYLLAVALAKTGGTPAQILEPLQKAVAGDYAKWGAASLEQPALQPFLATPIGAAWRQRVEQDRQTFVAALARSLIVTAHGDLFAYDGEAKRWYRLTRTTGAVIGAIAAAQRIAYVTRTKTAKHETKIAVGVVDLGEGRTRRAIEVATKSALTVGVSSRGFIVRAGKAAWNLVEAGKLELRPLAAKAAFSARLDVNGHSVHLARETIDNVSADWDHSLASAMRIGTSRRIVTVPSPGLIDRNTTTWSPDRTQLAFVAQLGETCAPGEPTAAAFVADAATGNVQELERAVGGLALEWIADRKLAIAGDHGVSLVAADGSGSTPLGGADGLLAPRRKPRCSPPEPVGEDPVEEEDTR